MTDAWKLGRKGVDDGVLLLVARDNPSALRRLRIEAGRGVQGVLTDAQSKRILQDVIAPHFRQDSISTKAWSPAWAPSPRCSTRKRSRRPRSNHSSGRRPQAAAAFH